MLIYKVNGTIPSFQTSLYMVRESELSPLGQSVWAAETQCVLECRIIVPVWHRLVANFPFLIYFPYYFIECFKENQQQDIDLPDVRHVLWDSSHICIVTTMHKHIAVTLVPPHNNVGGGRY